MCVRVCVRVCVCAHSCMCAITGQHCRNSAAAGHCRIAVLLLALCLLLLSLSLSPFYIHSSKLLKEDGESMCCILFQQGRRGGGCVAERERRRRRGQNHRGAKHAGEALCWATVPLRETTVEKLEMRKEEEEKERRWGEGRSEVQGTSGECGSSLRWQCSTHPQRKCEQENCRCSEMMSSSGCSTDPLVQFVIIIVPVCLQWGETESPEKRLGLQPHQTDNAGPAFSRS